MGTTVYQVNSDMNVCAIILARGGSKGIPRKNLIDFCGKPLLAWTVEQCLAAKSVSSVWVSSDSEEILAVSERYGARGIVRPEDISGDKATSETGWRHAIDYIESANGAVDAVLAPQVTSPLRHSEDIDRGLKLFFDEQYDSMFSCSPAEDLCLWDRQSDGRLRSINYDYLNRKRRQDFSTQYIENGSFYIFRPDVLRQYNNRFGGKIGLAEMDFWKMFEIDSTDDIRMCSALMKEFLLGK